MQAFFVNTIVLYLYYAYLVFGVRSLEHVFALYRFLPIMFFVSAIVHGLLLLIAPILKTYNQLSLFNLLAYCGVLSFLTGFIQHPYPFAPFNSLLEDYAASQLFYAPILYGMCAIEWSYIRPSIKSAA